MATATTTDDIGFAKTHADRGEQDTGFSWIVLYHKDGEIDGEGNKKYIACPLVERDGWPKRTIIYKTGQAPSEVALSAAYEKGYADGKGDRNE